MKANKILFLFCGALALISCGLTTSDEERLKRVDQHMTVGEYRTAMIELKTVLANDSNNTKARLKLAEVSFGLGEILDAEKELRRATALGAGIEDIRPLFFRILLANGAHTEVLESLGRDSSGLTQAQIFYFRGKSLLALQRNNAAESTYREWLNAEPNEPDAVVGLAETLAAKGEHDKAVADLDIFLASNSEHVAGWTALGKIYLSQSNYDGAETSFMHALDHSNAEVDFRSYVSLLIGLADAQLRSQNIDGAQVTMAHMSSLMPSAPPTLFLAARLAQIDNDYPAAERHLQQLLGIIPDSTRAQMMLAYVHMRQGDLGQAANLLNRVVTLTPDNMQARKLLAQVQLQQSQPRGAIEALAPLLDSHDADVYSLLAQANIQQGDINAAIANFRSASDVEPDSVGNQINLAVSYLNAGKMSESLEILTRIPEGQDRTYRRERLMIMAYVRSRDLRQANAVVDRLAATHDDDPVALNLAGLFHFGRGDSDRARSFFQRAKTIDAAHIDTLTNLARLETRDGNSSEARALFEAVQAIEPDHLVALLGLAELASSGGEIASAYDYLDLAITNHPTSVQPKLALAGLYLFDGRAEEAQTLAREAAKIGSANPAINKAVGHILQDTGAFDEALSMFELAARQAPGSAGAQLDLAHANLAIGQAVKARVALNRALELEPDWLPAKTALVLSELGSGQMAQAAQHVAELQKAYPHDVITMVLEGEVYFRQGLYGRAAESFNSAVRNGAGRPAVLRESQARLRGGLIDPVKPILDWLHRQPDDSGSRMFLANYYQTAGNHEAAIKEYEAVLNVLPDNYIALNNLAFAYQQQRNLDRALNLAQRAYTIRPESGSVADTLGWIYVDRGQLEQSLEPLRDAVALAPKNGEIQYHLAVALSRNGQADEARTLLTTLLEDEHRFVSREQARILLQQL